MLALASDSVAGGERLLGDAEPWTACGKHARAHVRALVAEASGKTDEAASLFAEAAEGWKSWGSIPLRAYGLIGVAASSGDSRARDEGSAMFARLGATPITPHVASARQQQV